MVVSSLATKYHFEGKHMVHVTKNRAAQGGKIDKIIIHHAAGTNLDIMPDCWIDREASCFYGIKDGVIRAYVGEENVCWHAGNWAANISSVGIEVIDKELKEPYPISDASYNSLVKLVHDIAKRNNLLPLKRGKNLFGHRDFGAPTNCPGNYLYGKLDQLAKDVNALEAKPAHAPITPPKTPTTPEKVIVKKYKDNYSVLVTGLNVRSTPTTKGKVIGSYSKPKTLGILEYKTADGYIWGKVHESKYGANAWVAIGKNTGKEDKSDFLKLVKAKVEYK
jgi:hypothetical protein